MNVVLWTAVILAIIFLIASFMLGDKPETNIRVWYFYGVLTYLIIGGVLIAKTDNFNIVRLLLLINLIAIILLLLGFILNFFIIFSLPLQVIFGWPAILSAIFFFALIFFACLGQS